MGFHTDAFEKALRIISRTRRAITQRIRTPNQMVLVSKPKKCAINGTLIFPAVSCFLFEWWCRAEAEIRLRIVSERVPPPVSISPTHLHMPLLPTACEALNVFSTSQACDELIGSWAAA